MSHIARTCWTALCVLLLPINVGVRAGPPEDGAITPGGASALGFLSYRIDADEDDGTEVGGSIWFDDGYADTDRNRMGVADAEWYDLGLRFHVPDIRRGESFVYARLRLPATDEGQVGSTTNIRIVGVDQDSPVAFGLVPPSQLPRTSSSVTWSRTSNWPVSAGESDCDPLYRYSPDIACIINEIVSRPEWGNDPDGKTLAIVLENDTPLGPNFLSVRDYYEVGHAGCPGKVVAPMLELYRNVRSTFVGQELLGCPTDQAVTVNAVSLLTLVAYCEFGTTPGVYTGQTTPITRPGGSPIEIVIDGLAPDTRYYYRLRYRRPDHDVFQAGPQRTFHTQRPPGATFTFVVQADSEIHRGLRLRDYPVLDLYTRALRNMAADAPDFLIDLGDTFHCESYAGRDVLDYEEALKRHLDQRPFLDLVCHSAPFFIALGNHEGEQGWRLDGTPANVAVWAANARKLVYPLPVPNNFYTGNTHAGTWTGLREDYYAWQWGDALFVVLDPYWYTLRKPHDWPEGEPGSGDNWDWTLGHDQYVWLRDTLEGSSAGFKFVFAHHVVGGVNTYGRGGIEAASHDLGETGSFEWGGEDLAGKDVFDRLRPQWGQPIHQLLAENNVTIFFHGHDHVFVKQELDGVVYQECPRPSDITYGIGHFFAGNYFDGDRVNNSGHLRVTVSLSAVTVEYVRAYLPDAGPNGEIAYSYTVFAANGDG